MSEYTLKFKENTIVLYSNIMKEDILTAILRFNHPEDAIRKSKILKDMTEAVKQRLHFTVKIKEDKNYSAQVSTFRLLLLDRLAEDNIFLDDSGAFYQEVETEEQEVEKEFTQNEELILLLLNDGYIIQKKDDKIIVLGKE